MRRFAALKRAKLWPRSQHGQDAGSGCLLRGGNVAIQTHGGFGFAEDYDIERKFRETRLYQVAPVSTNLILSYLAEHVLGLPRSY
jgi:acyl-CoA dehydrogenase